MFRCQLSVVLMAHDFFVPCNNAGLVFAFFFVFIYLETRTSNDDEQPQDFQQYVIPTESISQGAMSVTSLSVVVDQGRKQ